MDLIDGTARRAEIFNITTVVKPAVVLSFRLHDNQVADGGAAGAPATAEIAVPVSERAQGRGTAVLAGIEPAVPVHVADDEAEGLGQEREGRVGVLVAQDGVDRGPGEIEGHALTVRPVGRPALG